METNTSDPVQLSLPNYYTTYPFYTTYPSYTTLYYIYPYDLISTMIEEIRSLTKQILELKQEIKELRRDVQDFL